MTKDRQFLLELLSGQSMSALSSPIHVIEKTRYCSRKLCSTYLPFTNNGSKFDRAVLNLTFRLLLFDKGLATFFLLQIVGLASTFSRRHSPVFKKILSKQEGGKWSEHIVNLVCGEG